jgi:hypothetical protein
MGEQRDLVRPAVMVTITSSQLEELEFQFDENDRDEFNRRATGYGWSMDDADQVWNFLVAGKLQKPPHGVQ